MIALNELKIILRINKQRRLEENGASYKRAMSSLSII
jgi:hypothetical protein